MLVEIRCSTFRMMPAQGTRPETLFGGKRQRPERLDHCGRWGCVSYTTVRLAAGFEPRNNCGDKTCCVPVVSVPLHGR